MSPSGVSGQQSLDLRGWTPCVVPFVYGYFCLQICAFLPALNSVNYITLFMPACFVFRMDKSLGCEVKQVQVPTIQHLNNTFKLNYSFQVQSNKKCKYVPPK